MALSAGTKLGQYEVLSQLGVGGMGEVYRARDTRLNRDVALKVLPQAFAEDSQRMARFEREAQLLASLNHPKIAAIYGLEESGSTRALVMELVEGPTLAERIGRASASARPRTASASPTQSVAAGSAASTGQRTASAAGSGKTAIPLDEALPIAQQIAEALEYAHEHGVIHRDLKPANIKVTTDDCVKVLDFGLAKAMGPAEGSTDISNSPTLSLAMTEAGLIIGTAAYMAPEQAKGKPVDRRADIWAFGCVLYEMLTGKKAFEGETISDVLAAVIMTEPDWTALPETTPVAMQRLLRRCLQKDVRQRLQAIGDARIAIEETISGAGAGGETAIYGSQPQDAKRASLLRRALPWALGAAAIMFAAIAGYFVLQPKAPQSVMRFSVPPPENATLYYGGFTSISPDGRYLAFIATSDPNKSQVLWVRPLDSLTAMPIPGTEGAVLPFWSPNSQEIGFFADGKLEKVAVSGGPVQTLCDAQEGSGGTWNRYGVILFANNDSLYRVPDTGGTPTLVVAPDAAHHGSDYMFPQFLPDGRHFIFLDFASASSEASITAGSLDSKKIEQLAQVSSNAIYAPPGYLFYLDQSTLMARPLDAKALRFTGPAVPVAGNVGTLASAAYGLFSVSPSGVLAYQTGTVVASTQMTWFDRGGQTLGTVGQPDIYTDPALSPNGTRFAVAVGTPGKRDIWVYDLKRGTASRLTFNSAGNQNPTWSADGSTIFFSSSRASDQYGIYQKAADGLGSTQPVFHSKTQNTFIDDLSADGRYAMYDTYGESPTELWGLPLFGDRKAFVFVRAQGRVGAISPQFSPNSRYVAYSSDETGRMEIYVQSFPQPIGKWQISASGGMQPTWRHDGKELFYLTPDNQMMTVAVSTDSATFQAGIPKELFQTKLISNRSEKNSYVVSPDGLQFLMLVPANSAKPEPITVVLNWPTLLKK